jgi:hypothetical protein
MGRKFSKSDWKNIIDVPFHKEHLALQWELGRLFVFNTCEPGHRMEVKLHKMSRESNGTLLVGLSSGHNSVLAIIEINQDNSVAKLIYSSGLGPWKRGNLTEYSNPTPVLTWNADNTDLQWEKGGRLFAVERGGKGKIDLDLSNAPVHDGQFIVDVKTRDNKFIRVKASQNYDKAELFSFTPEDIAVENNRPYIKTEKTAQSLSFINPFIAELQTSHLDWVAERGYLEWQSGNQLFLVEAENMPGSEQRRVAIDLKAKNNSITINIGSEKHRVVLHISENLESARLRRLRKPASWSDRTWLYENNRTVPNPGVNPDANWHITVPFHNGNLAMQWKLGRLLVFNKDNPTEHRELNLYDARLNPDGTRLFTLHLLHGRIGPATISINQDLSAATLIRTIWLKSPSTLHNPTRILNWSADKTELFWKKGRKLFAVERGSNEEIELDLSKASIHNGQFIIDMKSTDNKLLRVNVSQDYHWARLREFDSLDFPTDDNGLAVIRKKIPVRQEKFSSPAIAALQQDWVADHGELKWEANNRLFLVNSTDHQNQRIEVFLKEIQTPGEPATIYIASGKHHVALDISADLRSASLRRFEKPDSWSDKRWSFAHNRTEVYRNIPVTTDVAQSAAVADRIIAQLKHPVPMFPDKPQKNTEQKLQDFVQQQPYRDIIGNLGEAIVGFQASPAAATGTGTHILPANIPMTGALVSPTL